MNKLKVFLVLLSICGFETAFGQTVYKTKTGTKYHTASHYANSTAITLTQAKSKGLGPCSVCKPTQTESSESKSEQTTTEANQFQTQTPKPKSSSSTSSKQCSGTTKAGARCKRTTTDPSGYCYQHKK